MYYMANLIIIYTKMSITAQTFATSMWYYGGDTTSEVKMGTAILTTHEISGKRSAQYSTYILDII